MRPEFNFRIAPISHKSENDNDIINSDMSLSSSTSFDEVLFL